MEMGGGLRYGPHPSGVTMMQIRMIADVAYPTGLLRSGMVYDMPAGEAEAMVLVGWAEDVSEDYAGITTTIPNGYDLASTLAYGRGETL